MKSLLWCLTGTLLLQTACSSIATNEEESPNANPRVEAKDPEASRTPTAVAIRAGEAQPYLPKKKILVLKFINRALYGGEELSVSTGWNVGEVLSKQPEIVVVHPEDIIGGEELLGSSGDYNLKTLFEKAKASGIVGIVGGAIEDLMIQDRGDEIGIFRTRFHTVNARVRFVVYDVQSEKPIFNRVTNSEVTEETTRVLGGRNPDSYDARRAQGAVAKALEPSLAQVPKLAKRIAWSGRIAKIDLHRYYINAGETSGLSRGQLLKVFGEGQAVIDSDSGVTLGIAPGRFKGTLKIVDYFGGDGTVAVIHSGAGFREKDRVEVYTP